MIYIQNIGRQSNITPTKIAIIHMCDDKCYHTYLLIKGNNIDNSQKLTIRREICFHKITIQL